MKQRTDKNPKGAGRLTGGEKKVTYIYTKEKKLEFVASSIADALKYLEEKTGYKAAKLTQHIQQGYLYKGQYLIADHLKWRVNNNNMSLKDIEWAQNWKFRNFKFNYED